MKKNQQLEINELREAVDCLTRLVSRRLPEPKPPVPIGEKAKDIAAFMLLFIGKLLLVTAIAAAVLIWTPWSWWHICTHEAKNHNPFAEIGVVVSGFAAIGLIIFAVFSLVEWAKDRIE